MLRFDRVERAVHWVNALLFLILIVTGAALYFTPLIALVGRRRLIEQIHLYVGLALPLPLLIGLAGSWGRGLRRDVSRINGWTEADLQWLRGLVDTASGRRQSTAAATNRQVQRGAEAERGVRRRRRARHARDGRPSSLVRALPALMAGRRHIRAQLARGVDRDLDPGPHRTCAHRSRSAALHARRTRQQSVGRPARAGVARRIRRPLIPAAEPRRGR